MTIPHRSTNDLVTATMWNELVDGINTGYTEVSASGIVQRMPQFQGLHLRTHPDADQQALKVELLRCDNLVMDDGCMYSSVPVITGDISASGAGGLDTGSRTSGQPYEVYAIGKSSTKSNSDVKLLFHAGAIDFLNQSSTTTSTTVGLRDTSSHTKIGQTVQVSVANQACPYVEIIAVRVGTPGGRFWAEIQDNSGTILATSDKFDASQVCTGGAPVIRLVFHTPYASFATSTTYRVALAGDFTIDGANYLQISIDTAGAYANGTAQTYNGTSWANTSGDLYFKMYLTTPSAAVTMPAGYDQKCLLVPLSYYVGSALIQFWATNRLVLLAHQTNNGTTTTINGPVLWGLQGYLPRQGCLAIVGANHSGGATADVRVSGIPQGYKDATTDQPGWSQVATIAGVGGGVGPFPMFRIPTEGAGLYTRSVTAGTVTLYVLGYEW